MSFLRHSVSTYAATTPWPPLKYPPRRHPLVTRVRLQDHIAALATGFTTASTRNVPAPSAACA